MSKVTNHRNFNADDFAYLTAKGWTEAEILARWDIERAPTQWTGATARAKLASTTGLRGTYQFQLTSGEMFTVQAGDVRSAWIAAVTHLADAGQLDGMAELTLVKVS